MDAFFCITLGTLVLYWYVKRQKKEMPKKVSDDEIITTIIPTIKEER